MAVRTDIFVRWNLSPRVIVVEDPSTELTIQDLVDTIRTLEYEYDNLDDDYIIDASGKEDLGGGTKVGITVRLNNAVVQFEGRTVSISQGTATSADAGGILLTDTSATFESDNLQTGDLIVNVDDGSITDVVEVVSEQVLKCNPLDDGAENDWDIGDVYKIWPIAECEITGGNLTAVDDVGANILPYLGSPNVVLSRASSASATLQEQRAVQFASFQNAVWIKTTGTAGTAWPIGTRETPVDNVADAVSIATTNGLGDINFLDDFTLTTGHDVSGYHLHGISPETTAITVEAGADISGCEIGYCTLNGVVDNVVRIHNTIVGTITNMNGTIIDSTIAGSVTLGNAAETKIFDCKSGVPGSGTPVVDCGGSGQALQIRNYFGGVQLTNKTGTEPVSIDMSSGQIKFTNSVTNGTIVCRGVGTITEDLSAGATIVNQMVNQGDISFALWNDLLTDYNIADSAADYLKRASEIEQIIIF